MIEKMCDYRDQGLTEAKIADRLSLIFMRPFTASSVNRKIRDLKRSGYLERNEHTGRFKNPLGNKREGENHEKTTKEKKSRKQMRRHDHSWDGGSCRTKIFDNDQ